MWGIAAATLALKDVCWLGIGAAQAQEVAACAPQDTHCGFESDSGKAAT